MILASNNKGKLREIKEILGDVELKTLRDVNIDIEVEEDQDTFYGNALKKAKEIYEILQKSPVSFDKLAEFITSANLSSIINTMQKKGIVTVEEISKKGVSDTLKKRVCLELDSEDIGSLIVFALSLLFIIQSQTLS